MTFPLAQYIDWFEENEEKIKQDFFHFLRFSSISTDPLHHKECLKTADWLISYLHDVGMKAELLESPGLPVVFADSGEKKGCPSVLLYHHYDVQPVDPVSLWESDPFSPRFDGERVFARGASDNKGQCFLTLTALKAMSQLIKDLPLQIKLFIEGEEESGGAGTYAVLKDKKHLLKADYLCVVDFDLTAPDSPSISMGYRGLAAFEIECCNAKTDMHSGSHGGIALNPIHILTNTIAKLWDDTGKITIPHFYEGIEPLSLEEKEKIDLSFDEEKYKKEFGVGAFCQEKGVTLKEANWLRPTLEVNGLWGGYTGAGFKTVIPAKAYAKISCRLVPGQDPEKIEKHLTKFFLDHTPKGAEIRIKWHHGAKAYRSNFSSPLVGAVVKSMEDVFQKPCHYTLSGGSIPIVKDLAEATGGEVALIGFALETDNIHAPNEHFRWECFKKGFLTMARLLWELAKEG
ncbi:MAG: dipeptidase [Verrucomicrobia bacterium]|nr:dipeptidase [Verrucomicrobiota bacterium]